MRSLGVTFLASAMATYLVWGLGCGEAFHLAASSSDGGPGNEAGSDSPMVGDTNQPVDGAPPEAGRDAVAHDAAACLVKESCGECGRVCATPGSSCNGGLVGGICSATQLAAGLAYPTGLAVAATGDVYVGVDGASGRCTNGSVLDVGPAMHTVASGIACGGTSIPVAVNSTNVFWAAANSVGYTSLGPPTGPMSMAFTVGTVTALGVDDKYAYVAADGVSIYYATIADTVPMWLPLATNTGGVLSSLVVAKDSTIYWADKCAGGTCSVDTSTMGLVGKAQVGAGMNTLADSNGPISIAVDTNTTSGFVVWADSTGIIEASDPNLGAATTTASPSSPPNQIAADVDGSVFWTDSAGGVWLRHMGGGTLQLAKDQHNAQAIAFDATTVYWVNEGGTGSVMSVSR
jgi:hypothetical protein